MCGDYELPALVLSYWLFLRYRHNVRAHFFCLRYDRSSLCSAAMPPFLSSKFYFIFCIIEKIVLFIRACLKKGGDCANVF